MMHVKFALATALSLILSHTATGAPVAQGQTSFLESKHFSISEAASFPESNEAEDAPIHLDQTYENTVIYLQPRIVPKSKIQLFFVGEKTFSRLQDKISFPLVAFTPSELSNGPHIFFKQTPSELSPHTLAHELFHVFDNLNRAKKLVSQGRWIQEGLAELLASKVSGLKPLLATSAFLSQKTPSSLIQNELQDFGLADYGQAFLFAEFLEEKYLNDQIFKTYLGQSNLHPEKVAQLVSSAKGSIKNFSDLYSEFVISLLEKLKTTQVSPDVLPGYSFVLNDVSFQMNEQIPFEIQADPHLDIYLVQADETSKAIIQNLKTSTPDRSKKYASSYLLVINAQAQPGKLKIQNRTAQ